MKQVDRLLLGTFLPVFFLSLSFFVLIIELMDLFANLVRYLNLDVPLGDIFRVQLLFIPRALVYALPVAILFAASYALGTLYSNNELIAVFGAGISLLRFTLPLIVFGFVMSIGTFFFQEYVVIDTFRSKNEFSRQLLNISRSYSNTNITVRSASGRTIYSAEYYNDTTRELSQILLLRRDDDGEFTERIDAQLARWFPEGSYWILERGVRYVLHSEPEKAIVSEPFETLNDPSFDLVPERFQRSGETVEEMRFDVARQWVFGLRDAGQPYRTSLTDYYGRFSFAVTPFIVVLLSSTLGGRFRKNVLLMSLFVSLVAAVLYYVTGMVAQIMAGDGVIPPLVGAWAGVVLFVFVGIILFRTART